MARPRRKNLDESEFVPVASSGFELSAYSTIGRQARDMAVISIGFPAEPFVPNQGDIPAFPSPLARDDYDLLVDTVRRGITDKGHVIALYPAWSPEPALQRLETVRSALDTVRLTSYGTPLPPLAGAVLAALASAVSPYISSAGALVTALPALEKELVVIAWLGSVAGLSTPAPSLWQHLVSAWPRSAFGVSFWPEPSVRLLTNKDRSVPVPTSYRPTMLAVSSHDGDAHWVKEVVGPALGSPPLKKVEPTPLGPKWWGTTKLTEAVAYPVDVPVIARRITEGQRTFLCRWCAEAIACDHCPFCGLETAEASLAGGAA